MKAISLLQPWATLVVMGAKKIETRSWQTKYRGELLIHASVGKKGMYLMDDPDFKKFLTPLFMDDPRNTFAFGAIIGRVELTIIRTTGELVAANMFQEHIQLSNQEKAFGDYTPGRYAWELKNPVMFDKPIPFKGSLSIWEFPDELLSPTLLSVT